jgi:hypothetical protein
VKLRRAKLHAEGADALNDRAQDRIALFEMIYRFSHSQYLSQKLGIGE